MRLLTSLQIIALLAAAPTIAVADDSKLPVFDIDACSVGISIGGFHTCLVAESKFKIDDEEYKELKHIKANRATNNQ